MEAYEVNFDGIVGQTHNYSGLAFGNIASMEHAERLSRPREAAKQGLAKMHTLMKLGLKQAVLPPQERPLVPLLRLLGFRGKDQDILKQVANEAPEILRLCSSSACMWAANAATIAPSVDTANKMVHLVPANLISGFHRSMESASTFLAFTKIFSKPMLFYLHRPLPQQDLFADEGAANHTRFCTSYGEAGLHLFVYGRSALHSKFTTQRFPARQTLEASQAISRLFMLNPEFVIFAQQNPDAVDAGVFHNDVISVGNQNVFFYHEKAFVETPKVIESLKKKFHKLTGQELICLEVKEKEIPIALAVKTYLFNSQLVTLPKGTMALILPTECQQDATIKSYVDHLLKDPSHPIKEAIYQNVRESMQNGGGPACLRLRVPLNTHEYTALNPNVILTEELYQKLVGWVDRHYRTELSLSDLADPQLLVEVKYALEELTRILGIGVIYPFQFERG